MMLKRNKDMNAQISKKQNNGSGSFGSIVAGVAGAVAVAGVTVAATIALRNKKNREKAKKILLKVKDQTLDYVDSLKKESIGDEMPQQATKIIKKVEKKIKQNLPKRKSTQSLNGATAERRKVK